MTTRVRRVWDRAWNAGDVEALDELLSVDYRRTSLLDPRVLDRSGMKQMIEEVRASFPDLRTTIDQCVESEEAIAILWSSVGTQLGEYSGIPPTGKSVDTAGASFCRLRDDMIVEEVETWDPRDILSALGIYSLRNARK